MAVNVVAVVCTHGHNDHVTVAPELGKTLDAPVLLHPADEVLWRMTHPDKDFRTISDGDTLTVAGTQLQALHTPGHSPGSVCWYVHELGVVFSGDTLFSGGPGATGRSLLRLPDDPAVDLRAARRVARRHRRAHRPRRQHHHRRRDRPLRGMGSPRALDSDRERACLYGDTPVRLSFCARSRQCPSRIRRFSVSNSSSVKAPESRSAARVLSRSSRTPSPLGS